MMVQYYCCGADIYQEAGAKWAVMFPQTTAKWLDERLSGMPDPI